MPVWPLGQRRKKEMHTLYGLTGREVSTYVLLSNGLQVVKFLCIVLGIYAQICLCGDQVLISQRGNFLAKGIRSTTSSSIN